ncbi:TULIP family P47-like protein [uncultured Roseobacter sp.]|uniref:TULIP family P47-like protein n=1 Tax=uncultured Roseobacter sp. TaxID=114847 RepID=UPI00260D340D|nr:TULIP family P47-like protein [uncultured Roseobacter sp.]
MDLYGWDTAYAVNISVLNDALKGSHDLPQTFLIADGYLKASGSLKNWRIVAGGSGILLHVQVEIATGTISGGADPKADLAGYQLIFEIDMTLLPAAVDGKQEIRLYLKSAAKKGQSQGEGVVAPYSITPQGKLGFEQEQFLPFFMAKYLVTQADKFTFALAQVNLVPPTAADSWLTPVEIAFTYYASGSAGDFLVIYGATRKRDVKGLSRNVDPSLFAGKGPAYYAISGDMFLEHVVMPLMPKVYPGFASSYFEFDAGNHEIINTKSMKLHGVKSGAITYYPVVRDLRIKISGDTLVSDVKGRANMYMGMSMTFSVTSRSKTSYDAAHNKFSAAKDAHPSAHHKSHIPWYDYLFGVIPDIIMAIVVPAVADGIADGLNSALSGMELANTGPQLVDWPGLDTFKPNAGGLNGAFQLSGS